MCPCFLPTSMNKHVYLWGSPFVPRDFHKCGNDVLYISLIAQLWGMSSYVQNERQRCKALWLASLWWLWLWFLAYASCIFCNFSGTVLLTQRGKKGVLIFIKVVPLTDRLKMNLNGLIPTRFMLLISHLVLTIILFSSIVSSSLKWQLLTYSTVCWVVPSFTLLFSHNKTASTDFDPCDDDFRRLYNQHQSSSLKQWLS